MKNAGAILFRCEATAAIGLGHLARDASLSAALRSAGARTVLLTSHAVPATAQTWLDRFDEHAVVGDDPAATWAEVARCRASALIVDGYDLGDAFFSGASGSTAAPAVVRVVVDDGPARRFDADLVVEPNLGSGPDGYATAPGGRVLAGSSFALLAPGWASARTRLRPTAPRAHRILVSCGGSDPTGMTSRWLDAIRLTNESLEIRVVIGPLNPLRDEMVELARERNAEPLVGVDDLVDHALWCDLALTTLSGTASELACLGVPNLVVSIHPKQIPHLARYSARGFVMPMGRSDEFKPGAAAPVIKSIVADASARTRMREAGMAAVDGLGAPRLAIEILRAVASRSRMPHDPGVQTP